MLVNITSLYSEISNLKLDIIKEGLEKLKLIDENYALQDRILEQEIKIKELYEELESGNEESPDQV